MRRDVGGGGDGGCEEETVSSYSPVNLHMTLIQGTNTKPGSSY